MTWLYGFIIRLAAGERWRKATPTDKKLGAGSFFAMGLSLTVFLLANHFSHPFRKFMDLASPITLWLAMVVVISLGGLGLLLWCKYLTTRVSVICAAISWTVLLSLIFFLEWLPH